MPHRAFIVAVARSAAGKNNGRISHVHPAALGAKVVDSLLLERLPSFDPALVDDVIFGCVSQVGAQSANLARNVVLGSSVLPLEVPGTTVDRQCGSSQQALHFAVQAVMSGTQDVVVAGGVESMSSVPIGCSITGQKELGLPNSPACQEKYGRGGFYSQFFGAERLSSEYDISRHDMDAFAASSHAKAVAAQEAGRFDGEIVPMEGRDKAGETVVHATDEGVRPGTTVEKLGKLDTLASMGLMKPMPDAPDGRVTAGNASQISDGASAVVVCNEEGLRKLGGAVPLVEVKTLALAGSDPVTMLGGPIPATARALKRAGLSIGDIDLYEVNEAFACVPIAWLRACGADEAKLNVLGGACALGHPLGATGTKLATTLVSELVRSGKSLGLQAICEGGGTANATIFERV